MNETGIAYMGPREIDLDEELVGELMDAGGVEAVVSLWDARGDKDEVARITCAGMSKSRVVELVHNRARRAVTVLSGPQKIHVAINDASGSVLGLSPFTIMGGAADGGDAGMTPDERGVTGLLMNHLQQERKNNVDLMRARVGSHLRESDRKDKKIDKLEARVESDAELREKLQDRTVERKIAEMKAEANIETTRQAMQILTTIGSVVAAKFSPPGSTPKLHGPVMTDAEVLFFRVASLMTTERWQEFIMQCPEEERLLWSTVREKSIEHGTLMEPPQMSEILKRGTDLIFGWKDTSIFKDARERLKKEQGAKGKA
jgi:hypothetical protein